ncbi:hypothetical protein BKA70DRAFT_1427650 [Coprinopsis sp. MPI-PUGE-AT-0042]|nr:hypothetical protein BKA70DRAFT_1427650 [Coprinopsis sp. MPI-PUGE-AT-0042]
MSSPPSTPPARHRKPVFASPGGESVSSVNSSASVDSESVPPEHSTPASSPSLSLLSNSWILRDDHLRRSHNRPTVKQLEPLPPHVINKMSAEEVQGVLEEVRNRIIEKVEAEKRLLEANDAWFQVFPVQESFVAGLQDLDHVKQELVHRTLQSLPSFINAF